MKYPTAKQVILFIEGLCNEKENLSMDLVWNSGIEIGGKTRLVPVSEKQRKEIIDFMHEVYQFSHFFLACGRRNHKSDLPLFWERAKEMKKNGVMDIWKRDDFSWYTKLQKRAKEYDKQKEPKEEVCRKTKQ
jgi:hypothetical protein